MKTLNMHFYDIAHLRTFSFFLPVHNSEGKEVWGVYFPPAFLRFAIGTHSSVHGLLFSPFCDLADLWPCSNPPDYVDGTKPVN